MQSDIRHVFVHGAMRQALLHSSRAAHLRFHRVGHPGYSERAAATLIDPPIPDQEYRVQHRVTRPIQDSLKSLALLLTLSAAAWAAPKTAPTI